MFERFTEQARRVIILAQEEAKRLNHSAVGTEHILLGIIREGKGVASKVLESLNISPDHVRAEIETAIGRGEQAPYEEAAFTPRAKRVLELAVDESRRLRHSYVGTEHLLLGLIREGEGVAARLLQSMGMDLKRTRARVVELLAEVQNDAEQLSDQLIDKVAEELAEQLDAFGEPHDGGGVRAFDLRAAGGDDHKWMDELLRDHWGGSVIVSRGRTHDARSLPAIIAERKGQPCGLATYRIDGHECELVTLDALFLRQGVGDALLDAVVRSAKKAGCTRLWVITTNDNFDALRFYQRRDFSLVAVHRNAVTQTRHLKPLIAQVGNYGIPIRDVLELERLL